MIPPNNTYVSKLESSPNNRSATSQWAKMQRDKERAAHLATPEGQAEQQAAAQEQAASMEAIREVLSEYGFGNDDMDENSAHSKKHKKNHQKHEPKKSTGFLSGLMTKLKGKG
jgi:DNA-binding protein H-NS